MKKSTLIICGMVVLLLMLASCTREPEGASTKLTADNSYNPEQTDEVGVARFEKDNPIDRDYQMEFHQLAQSPEFVTDEWLELEGKYTKIWDTELNNTYNLLLGKLDDHQKDVLRKAQKGWLQFHLGDSEFIRETWGPYGLGSLEEVDVAASVTDRIRQRTFQLMLYYEMLGGETELIYQGMDRSKSQ